MKIKTISATLLLSLVMSLGIIPEVNASAALNKTVLVKVGTHTERRPYQTNALWDAFSDKYGVFDDTYFYDDGTESGVLHATRIKLVPKNKVPVMETNREMDATTSVEERVSTEDYAPSFDERARVKVWDEASNKEFEGFIGKSGAPTKVIAQKTPVKYVSWGKRENYNKNVSYRFYGVQGGDKYNHPYGSFSSAVPSKSLEPKRRFYGLVPEVLTAGTDFKLNTWDEYINPYSQKRVRGMTWGENEAKSSTEFAGDIIWSTQIPESVGRAGHTLIEHVKGEGYRWRSESTVVYVPKTSNIKVRVGPGSSYSTKGNNIPSGTKMEATMRQGDWVFVAVSGISGWVHTSNLAVVTVNTGENYNLFRKGIVLLYDLIHTEDVYTQNYAGKVALPDVIKGYDTTEWDVYVEYSGIGEYTNNLKINTVTVNPTATEIPLNATSTKANLQVNFEAEFEVTEPYRGKVFDADIDITNGDTLLWTGTVRFTGPGKVSRTISLTGVNVFMGINQIKVTINGNRDIREQILGGKDPYFDNDGSANHMGIKPSLSNFVMTKIKALPKNAQLGTNDSSKTQTLTLEYEVEHKISTTPYPALLKPLVVVKLGNKIIHSETIEIVQGTQIKRTVTIPNVQVFLGTNMLSIEVNADRKIPEILSDGGNPYTDNIITLPYLGIRHVACNLPTNRRTQNTWTERWYKDVYYGSYDEEGYCYIADSSHYAADIGYRETYEIVDVYFRSKVTTDNKDKAPYNTSPRGDGWVKVENGSVLKVKAGYAFELVASTYYYTNRTYRPYGPGYSSGCGYTSVYPSVTPIQTPTVLYLNLSRGASADMVCKIMVPKSTTGSWNNSTKEFELPLIPNMNGQLEKKIYTNVGAIADVYDVSIATPRPDMPNAFRGYEPESPVSPSNKNYLHDFIKFKIEVLGQDDIKSHIVH